MALISCIKQATEVCVLQTRSQGRNYNVPGWSDLVKENHDVARSAFLDWVSVGRSRTGPFHKHMCYSRAHFKLALRQCRVHEKQQKADARTSSLLKVPLKHCSYC